MSIKFVFDDANPKRIRSSGLRIDELRYESCRYIISSETALSVRYCGHKKVRGAYCLYHAELCYLPPKIKNKAVVDLKSV